MMAIIMKQGSGMPKLPKAPKAKKLRSKVYKPSWKNMSKKKGVSLKVKPKSFKVRKV